MARVTKLGDGEYDDEPTSDSVPGGGLDDYPRLRDPPAVTLQNREYARSATLRNFVKICPGTGAVAARGPRGRT
ncbi:hypothetical protein GCM10008097_25320 [Mycetocola manganoxydans]|nr:hypothetical protein GCM10008097_25320 [Mycetocola manganoxydans]